MTISETEKEKNTDKKTGMPAVIWSSARACVFLAAAIVFFVIGYPLKPGGAPQLQPVEPTVTVVTNDPHPFAGSVNMSLSVSGQNPQLYNLKLTITPATHVGAADWRVHKGRTARRRLPDI